MARFGLCGGAYTSQSVNADAQSCVNLYQETDESGQGKSAVMLYHTPGLKSFAQLPGMSSVPTIFYCEVATGKRCFAVGETQGGASGGGFLGFGADGFGVSFGGIAIGSTLPITAGQVLFEIFASGQVINRGMLGGLGRQASLAVNNGNQLLIASGGMLFLFDLKTNLLTVIDTTSGSALQGPVALVGFVDSFFVALLSDSQKVQFSSPLDGTQWDPLDIFQVSVYPDNVLSMAVDHREIGLLGPKASVVYVNTGDALNPFQPASGGFIEQGTCLLSPPVKLDNSTFWLGGSERGNLVAFRANGYTPTRISTHAMETAWQGYPNVSDVESYSYEDQGHAFWVIRFPSGNATWVYDVAENSWHQRKSTDPRGQQGMHRSRCHAFAFGKHLVGDWATGKIYEMSIKFLDDDGLTITRQRAAPHISNENQWMYFNEMILDIETGLGAQTQLLDGEGQPREAMVLFDWSDDGGHSWSSQHPLGLGMPGEYRKRVRLQRMGRSRDRIPRFTISDPIPVRIIDGYIEASPGYKIPSPRLAKQLSQIS